MDDTYARPRDRHLFSPGRKRILSLDGGGVRGAVSIAFLERIEHVLADIEGRDVRLCEYFDLIGGTSTGAIIAAGLATGFSAGEIHTFYERLAPKVFRSSMFHLPGWHANFDGAALHEELDRTFSGCTLGSEKLKTGLCMVLKRLDTGSCWIVMNNPRSVFWETPQDNSFVGNSYLSLPDVIRASTAAPYYFDPQTIEIVKGMEPGLFLDGGLTPHNNPSLALFLTAVLPPYRLEWKTGVDDLFILSVGTGSYRPKLTTREAQRAPSLLLAINALAAQISDNQELTLTLMSWLGQSSLPWPINSELGDLKDATPPFGKLFHFHRCDIKLEQQWLTQNVGVTLSADDIVKLRQMENPDNIPSLYSFGKIAAEKQITHELLERAL
ncbi:patatin-like phospholipase family protein [Methylocystis sp. IM3]|jgi:hypothetical protein|uniref:patatin-like phospholipase family protein n=1 Tax=unclassified Methylocystis TaxID=2625913 RepID=UPI00269A5BD8